MADSSLVSQQVAQKGNLLIGFWCNSGWKAGPGSFGSSIAPARSRFVSEQVMNQTGVFFTKQIYQLPANVPKQNAGEPFSVQVLLLA